MKLKTQALRIKLRKAVESYVRLCEKYGDDTPVAMGAQTKVHRLGLELRKKRKS